MKITFPKFMSFATILLSATALLVAGCKSTSGRTVGQKMADRQIAKDVARELDSDPLYKYSNVKPNVYYGTVQLTGFVETPQQRQRAGELAMRVREAREIDNAIMVKPSPTGPTTVTNPQGRETGRLITETNALYTGSRP